MQDSSNDSIENVITHINNTNKFQEVILYNVKNHDVKLDF